MVQSARRVELKLASTMPNVFVQARLAPAACAVIKISSSSEPRNHVYREQQQWVFKPTKLALGAERALGALLGRRVMRSTHVSSEIHNTQPTKNYEIALGKSQNRSLRLVYLRNSPPIFIALLITPAHSRSMYIVLWLNKYVSMGRKIMIITWSVSWIWKICLKATTRTCCVA
jgi:hypothetical protein